MELSGKQSNRMHLCMCMILFLKVMSDLFYQIQIGDIVLTGCAVLLLGYTVYQKRIRLHICDLCILALAALFTVSFLKDVTYYRDYIKIMSGFMLYFLGRYGICETDTVSKTLSRAFLIAFAVNVLYCALGLGTIKWGNAITYRGTYYFKTDFAEMISFFLVFFLIKEKKFGWPEYVMILLAGYFTVMTNARIFYLIFFVMLGFVLMYKKQMEILSVKSILVLVISCVIGVLAAVIIPKLPFFANRNMISFDLESVESGADLFGNSNMQGRNNIWKAVLGAFSKTGIMTRLFGAELSFNNNYGLPGYSEHSLYVKLILNSGYAGLAVWFLFLLGIVYFVWKSRNRKAVFLGAMLLSGFLIQGISVETIAFTDSSWMTMFFCGLICSAETQDFHNYKKQEQCYE